MPIKNEEAIKTLNEILEKQIFIDSTPQNTTINAYEAIETVLNMLKEKDKEIDKLRNKNKKLLRKLRNRVKEVKKLTKYSQYKKEFSRLNEQLRKKDKQIDSMAEYISNLDIDEDICKEQSDNNCDDINREVECRDCIKQYFERKVEDGEN